MEALKRLGIFLASTLAGIVVLLIGLFMAILTSIAGFIVSAIGLLVIKTYVIRSWLQYRRNKRDQVS